MTVQLSIKLTFERETDPGSRLAWLVTALAGSGAVDNDTWTLERPFSSKLRSAHAKLKRGPELPWKQKLAIDRLEALLKDHADLLDAVSVNALSPLWIHARYSKKSQAEIDLGADGLQLFEDPTAHAYGLSEAARLDAEIAEAEANHEHWRLDDLRDHRKHLAERVRGDAQEWFFGLVETLAPRPGLTSLLAGPAPPRLTPSTARFAWYPSAEAYKEALDLDVEAHGRYSRITARAFGRASDHEMALGSGLLFCNPELNPVGEPLSAWLETMRG